MSKKKTKRNVKRPARMKFSGAVESKRINSTGKQKRRLPESDTVEYKLMLDRLWIRLIMCTNGQYIHAAVEMAQNQMGFMIEAVASDPDFEQALLEEGLRFIDVDDFKLDLATKILGRRQ